MQLFKKIYDFILQSFKNLIFLIRGNIWLISVNELKPVNALFIKALRVILLTFRKAFSNDIQIRASALTYYSFLSIVPIAAMVFGIAKSFGYAEILENQIRQSISGQDELINRILEFSNKLIASTSSGFLTGIGMVVLIWSVVNVLSSVESAFNKLWDIKRSRPWIRKFTDYLTIMIIAPVFMVLASSSTVYISERFDYISESFKILGYLRPLIVFLIQSIPFLLIWIIFILLYIIIPNTKVKFMPAFIAGIIAGTAFQILQIYYFKLQIGVSRYNAIYGGFAAIPLFLIWMQFSWLVVLAGAELAFSLQNSGQYEYETELTNLALQNRKILSLLVANCIFKNFEEGNEPLDIKQIASIIKIPSKICSNIVSRLIESKLICEIYSEKQKIIRYQPMYDIHKITIQDLFDKIEQSGSSPIKYYETDQYLKILHIFENKRRLFLQSDFNILVKDL
jgi:membrane protein